MPLRRSQPSHPAPTADPAPPAERGPGRHPAGSRLPSTAPHHPRSRRRAGVIAVGALAAGALVAALAGCSGSESSSSTTTTEATGTVVTAPGVPVFSDPGQPIEVPVGQQFAIVLDAEPAAGYSWLVVTPPDPAIVLSIGTEFRDPLPDDGAATTDSVGIGAVRAQVLRYGGLAPGSTQIGLTYAHPDGTPAPGDQTRTFQVTVYPPGQPPTTTVPPPDSSSSSTSIPTAPASTASTTRARVTTTTTARTTTTT